MISIIRKAGLHNSESWKGQNDQHKFAPGHKFLIRSSSGLLFHMTQPTSRSTTKSHRAEQTNH